MSSSPFATLPPVGFGPGSQPTAEEEGLAYLPMPSGMRTFEAHLPEVEDKERCAPALAVLQQIVAALNAWTPGAHLAVSLAHLDRENLALVDETLGEGEVAVKVAGDTRTDGQAMEIQEATFAGVWRLRGSTGADRVEVSAFPRGAVLRAHTDGWRIDHGSLSEPLPGIFNAPALLTEIDHQAQTRAAGAPPQDSPHVINLSLLPHTPEDLALLAEKLGDGATVILSRGYGNCRIDACALKGVWRVRFYNSTDALILDTIEVTEVPEVACAAPEDIADSAERLAEMLAALS